jgi:hypothetical protein
MTMALSSIFHLNNYSYRSASSALWMLKSDWTTVYATLVEMVKKIVRDYFVMGVALYAVALYAIASVFFIIYVLYCSGKSKNIWTLLYGGAVYASLYALTFVQGEPLGYRACQTFSVFVGFMLFSFARMLQNASKEKRIIGSALIGIVLVLCVVELNRWFVLDYRKYSAEMENVDQIAYDLENGGYDLENKKVMLVGVYQADWDLIEDYYIERGEFGWNLVNAAQEWLGFGNQTKFCFAEEFEESILGWSVEALFNYEGYNSQAKKLFDYRGHYYNWADSERYRELMHTFYDFEEGYWYAKENAYSENEGYPNSGYIIETDDLIIIRL